MKSIAQICDHYFQYNDYKASAGFDLSYDINSTSITNKFLNKFLFGDHIDAQNKQWMFAGLKPDNTFGADVEGGISFVTFPDTFAGSTNMGLFVKYNKYYHADLSFTRDLFELFFDGNERFAGQEADLSNSSLNLVNYEQLQLGILTKFGDDKIKHTFGIGVSLNNGYQNTRIDIKDGKIYTDVNAEYLDFSANYDIYRSDTSTGGSNALKGFGTSANIYYSFITEKKNIFDLELTDFGFITWNKNSQQFSRDTAFHFEGINVDDILNINGSIFDNANPDSVFNSYTYADTTMRYTMMTPACLKISYQYNFSEKTRMEFCFKKKFFSHYDPFFLVKAQWVPTKNNIISFNFSYGGYGSANPAVNHNGNFGLEYAHDFGKGMVMIAGTNYINGFIYPYSTTGQGAFITLKKYFL